MISRSQDVNIHSNELETIHHSSSKSQENKIIENGQPEVETTMWIRNCTNQPFNGKNHQDWHVQEKKKDENQDNFLPSIMSIMST